MRISSSPAFGRGTATSSSTSGSRGVRRTIARISNDPDDHERQIILLLRRAAEGLDASQHRIAHLGCRSIGGRQHFGEPFEPKLRAGFVCRFVDSIPVKKENVSALEGHFAFRDALDAPRAQSRTEELARLYSGHATHQ